MWKLNSSAIYYKLPPLPTCVSCKAVLSDKDLKRSNKLCSKHNKR